jgi:hypothetical protein
MPEAGDHDDRAARGSLASAKACENVSSLNRKLQAEQRLCFPEELAHGAGVSDEKKHTVDSAIPNLEVQSSKEGLCIARRGLTFDAEQPTRPTNRAIPRALIAGQRQGHLSGPTEDRVKHGPEVPEQLGLRRVTQRVRAGIELAHEVEPDHRRKSRQRDEWHVRRSSSFDPADFCVRDA